MALKAQAQRLHAHQQHEAVERRDARTQIAQQHAADIRDERRRSIDIGERRTVIAGIRLADLREFAALLPIKLAGIDNDAAQRRSMSADELGSTP